MPKNPEKKESSQSQSSDEEKRELDAKLEEEEKKPKEIGWEKFGSRQDLIKEVKEEIELKKREKEISLEEEKELGLTKEREDLEKAFEGSEKPGEEGFKKYIDQNLPERLEEKKKNWQEEINKTRTPKGQELMAAEKRSLGRDLYLKELSSYSIKYEGGIRGTLRGFFTGKEKARILKDGKPVEKEGKPLEFKVNWAWKNPEKDMIEFFKSEIENKIKEDLKKEWEERVKKETERRAEAPVTKETLGEDSETSGTRKEETELNKKPLIAPEFYALFLKANNLGENMEIPPGKLEQARREWEAYQKEMGIEESKKGKSKTKKREERKGETAKAVTQKEKEISPSIREKLIKFFETFKIEQDESKRTTTDRQIQKVLEELKVGKIGLAGKEISRMLTNGRRNLEAVKKRKDLKLAERHEDNIKKLEGFLEEIKSPAVTEKTETTQEQLSKILESATEETIEKKDEEKPKEEKESELPGEKSKSVEREKKVEKGWKGIDFKKMEAEGVFEKIKEMNMEKNAKDIIGIIKKYGPETFLPVYIEKLLKQYDQQRPEQYKFEKVKNSPKIIKEWLATFLTDIKYPERVKRLREIKLGVEKKEEAKKEVGEKLEEEKSKIKKTEQVFPVESILTEEELEKRARDLIEKLDKGNNKILLDSPLLRNYLLVKGSTRKEVYLMTPEEMIERTKGFLGIRIKNKEEETLLPGEDGEELEGRPRKNKRKEVNKGEKKLGWMEHVKKLRENGTFKFRITSELKKFFMDRRYTQEEIREMGKNPRTAWDKALEIYEKEQREAGEK